MNIRLKFKLIHEYIDELKKNKNVIGIVEYGSRKYLDNDHKKIGDYDLTVILKEHINNKVEGFHFFLNGILVDCMVKTIEDFYSKKPLLSFDLVHLDCRIIFDRNGDVQKAIEYIKEKWCQKVGINEWYIERYRYKFSHLLFKANSYYLKNENIAARYILDVAFDTFLNFYTTTNNLQMGKYSLIFNHMMENNHALYEQIIKYQGSVTFEKMYIYMNVIFSILLKKIWRRMERK